MELQKAKNFESPPSRRPSEATSISSPINTTVPVVNNIIQEEPSSPTPIPKKIEEEEENYPPAIRRKAKEPRQVECDVLIQLQNICFNMDPNEIYKDMVKIGQG